MHRKENEATKQLMEQHQYEKEVLAVAENELCFDPAEEVAAYEYERLELPKDAEGYVETFALEEEDAIRDFYRKYGVVVIRDVLNEQQCAQVRRVLATERSTQCSTGVCLCVAERERAVGLSGAAGTAHRA